MNPQKHSASVAEEQMLAHFRAHTPQQPVPALDQAILAAARRQAAHVEPARSWWRRWLEASRRPRWQAAFASLLGVALVLGLGLVSHNVLDDAERPAPPEVAFSDVPLRDGVTGAATAKRAMRAPAAPAPLSSEMSEPPALLASYASSGEAPQLMAEAAPPAPAALADRPPAQAAQQAKVQAELAGDFVAQARGKAVAVKPEVLDEALGAVLALREQGKTEQAATQLAELQKRFPGENLLERLERLATIAASARKQP
ncbi:anti-sigma factor SbrR [Pseudomonas aeruginosa]|uniref:anti-sigma factor SbrR n=1 Tax=Pseudomonas aeruginosa TaxID=287 RepID=UPI000EAF4688|nr:anti-sigma factor SbrR [Pseudomonas aeruginosa]MEB6159009.1 anti-sigma factor SbrR [Pseudomonas aeruginosa]